MYDFHASSQSCLYALGREVAMLMFCIDMSEVNKMVVWLKIIPSLRSAQWSGFCKQMEWEQNSSQDSECLQPDHFQQQI
jgi:hypothetical protein